jgi:hypothetical protein
MALSPEKIIETICPELSGSPSLQVYLGLAVEVTSRGFFGSLYNQAVAYRAAHLFTVMDASGSSSTVDAINELGGGAPVASMSEGGLSVSFAQSGAGGTDGTTALGSTKYGRMLLGLIKARPRMGVNMAGYYPPHGGY